MCGRGLESWNVMSQSHVTCVTSLTNGQMTHVHSVVTLNMCPPSHVLTCLSSCDVQICSQWKSESPSHQSISLSPQITSPATPLSAHPSSNTISAHIPISLRSWQHIHFHPQWRNQSVASQAGSHTDQCYCYLRLNQFITVGIGATDKRFKEL